MAADGPARARAAPTRRAGRASCSPATSAAARATSRSCEAILDAAGGARRREPRAHAALRRRAHTRTPRRSSTASERLTYAELRDAGARGSAAGLARPGRRARAIASPRSLEEPHRDRPLCWACQWLGAVFVPLNCARPDEVVYCVRTRVPRTAFEDGGAAVAPRSPTASAARVAGAAGEPRSTHLRRRAAAEPSSTTASPRSCSTRRGRPGGPKGVPRSHRAERAGGALAGRPARLRRSATARSASCRSTTRWAMHSMLAMSLRRRVLRRAAATGARSAALRLIERERLTSLYLAPTLFHDLVDDPRLRRARTSPACARSATRARR